MSRLGEALAVAVGAGIGWWLGGRTAEREAALTQLADELLVVGQVLDQQTADLAAAAAELSRPAAERRPLCLEECCRR